jgi:hypothetical protein
MAEQGRSVKAPELKARASVASARRSPQSLVQPAGDKCASPTRSDAVKDRATSGGMERLVRGHLARWRHSPTGTRDGRGAIAEKPSPYAGLRLGPGSP